MTDTQKAALRLSQIRVRLNELNALDDLDETQTSERAALVTEYGEVEIRWQSLVISDDGDAGSADDDDDDDDDDPEGETPRQRAERLLTGYDGEVREIHGLQERAGLGNYIAAAAGGAALQGAEAELNAALKITGFGGGATIPYDVLLDPVDYAECREETRKVHRRMLQFRADIVTTTADLDGGVMQRNIFRRLFGRGILDYLNVRIDSVAQGRQEYPLLTGGVDPDMVLESAQKDAAKATFTPVTLKPKRLTGRYVWTVEQQAQIGPGLETALRRDLADAIRAEQSVQVMDGDGTAPNVTGLLSRYTRADKPAAAILRDGYLNLAVDGIDGLHAYEVSEVKLLFAVDAYKHGHTLYKANGNDLSAIELIKGQGSMARATTFLPNALTTGAHSNTSQGVRVNGNVEGASVAAMWPGISLIRDNVTQAGKGEVIITWITLWDLYMALRTGSYSRFNVRLS